MMRDFWDTAKGMRGGGGGREAPLCMLKISSFECVFYCSRATMVNTYDYREADISALFAWRENQVRGDAVSLWVRRGL